ncbi:unnamed protein product, partial [Prorocentrum cordatum]
MPLCPVLCPKEGLRAQAQEGPKPGTAAVQRCLPWRTSPTAMAERCGACQSRLRDDAVINRASLGTPARPQIRHRSAPASLSRSGVRGPRARGQQARRLNMGGKLRFEHASRGDEPGGERGRSTEAERMERGGRGKNGRRKGG